MRRFSAPDLATSMVENGARDSSLYFTQQNLHNGMQFAMDSKTRCPCGTTMEFGSMIQCDVPSCLARQHVNCVILPEKEDTKPEIPTKFFCELCRIQHGDPFCVSVAHPLMPIKTLASMVYSSEGGSDGTALAEKRRSNGIALVEKRRSDGSEKRRSDGEVIPDHSLVQTVLDALPESYQTFASTWRLVTEDRLDAVRYHTLVSKLLQEAQSRQNRARQRAVDQAFVVEQQRSGKNVNSSNSSYTSKPTAVTSSTGSNNKFEKTGDKGKKKMRCNYCKANDHVIKSCPKLKAKEAKKKESNVATIADASLIADSANVVQDREWAFSAYCHGATKHITSHRDMFTSLEVVPNGNNVTCANNASYPVKGVSKIVLTVANDSSFTLLDALASVIQNLEASFIITENDRDLLQYPEYDLQIWCVLLGDEVPYRMHWPLKADLRVNGDFVRVTNRPGQQKLGANGRDDGPVITSHTREGINRILFTAFDGRSFCLGVRIVRRLTIDQVLSQVPGEGEGESFGVALERVCRCISGGGAVGDDSDSELEVVSEWVTVNLRCPMSGSRIKVAGRFKPCMHMGCFDLHTFVQLNERARKWQCPICLKNYSLKDLVIDPFFTQITRALESYDEDVSEVEMKPDGFWRPKLDGDAQFNESWRSPGCLNNMVTDVNTMATDVDDFNLGFNIAEVSFESTQDGLWKAKGTLGPEDLTVSDMILGHSCEVIKNMARSHKSTASVSREVSSVNQEPKKVYRYYGREEVEVNSCPFIAHVTDYPSAFFGNVCDQGVTTEVILLSDEEDNSTAFNTGAEGPGAGYVNCVEVHEDERGYYDHYSQGGFLHNYPEAGIAQPEVGFCQSNMTVAVDFLGMGQEPSAISAYKGMCQTENDVGSYDFLRSAPESFMDQSSHLIDSSPAMQAYNSSVFLNQFPKVTSVLVDTTGISPCEETPVTCAPEYETLCKESSQELAASDPSFREFLPHQPARSAANLPGHERREALTDDMQVGWFSLSLGGSESVNATVPLHEPSAQKTQIDPLVESASLLLDLSHGKPRVDGSFFGSNRTKGAFSSKHLKVSCSLSVFSNEIPL
ncbi:hypothetical protein L7F22_046523 [Adiantum nelumboides]|nr:hypothetical protein [Adiantum nelumboides]